METSTLPSGKVITLNKGSFDEASALRRTLMEELALVDVTGLKLGGDLKALMQSDASALKSLFCTLLKSKKLEDAVLLCAKRCAVGEEQVTKAYFDDAENWGDYFPILWEVAHTNVAPFFASLLSSLSARQAAGESTQRSK